MQEQKMTEEILQKLESLRPNLEYCQALGVVYGLASLSEENSSVSVGPFTFVDPPEKLLKRVGEEVTVTFWPDQRGNARVVAGVRAENRVFKLENPVLLIRGYSVERP